MEPPVEDVEIVKAVLAGFPCPDISIAGLRMGFKGRLVNLYFLLIFIPVH